MSLPQDPLMLMSFVNMKLRDGEYSSLEDFCRSFDVEEGWLTEKLKSAGYVYNDALKQFRPL